MKKIYFKILTISILAVMLTSVFSSCDKWTETESIDLNQPNIQEQNPEMYNTYLANLRDYRLSDHKQVLVWYDNSVEVPVSRADHISALPDSIDMVVLTSPDNLSDYNLEDMSIAQTDKGMKFLYAIDYDATKASYDQAVMDGIEPANAEDEDPFMTYLVKYVDNQMSIFTKYSYDGLIMSYKGKSPLGLNYNQLTEIQKYQDVLLNALSNWKSNNADKMLLFRGYPDNLIDKSILSDCEYIIIDGSDNSTQSAEALIFQARRSSVEGVPTDRFIFEVSTFSLESDDNVTGYFSDDVAITEMANNIYTNEDDIVKAGLGISNVKNDYYHPYQDYQYTRKALNIMNPTPKK
ncbi:MAG: glycoside hydrolase family 18 [Bacteroidales bacterium]